MRYRLLLPSEYNRLESLVTPDQPLPPPETSCISIAEDDHGNIQGFLVLQLIWHLEPLRILDSRVNFLSLKSIIDNQLKDFPGSCYYAHIDNARVAEMAERANMKALPVMVFMGEGGRE